MWICPCSRRGNARCPLAKRICNSGSRADIAEANEVAAESFPSFDLTVLTRKQLDVVVMRYRGDLSLRKIAAFEGVHFTSVRDRLRCAQIKMRAQIPYDSHKDRGAAKADRIPRTVAGNGAAPFASGQARRSGAADVAAEGGGCDTFLSWEEMYEQEWRDEEAGRDSKDESGCATPPPDREGTDPLA